MSSPGEFNISDLKIIHTPPRELNAYDFKSTRRLRRFVIGDIIMKIY